MAIDPNIAMSFKPTTELNLQPTNILAQYGQLAAIQNAQNQNALAQFQLESARRQDVAQNALNKAWQESITPEGKVDYNRLIGTLAAGGAGAQIPSVQKLRTEESKAATEEAARRAKLVVDKTAMYRDMVGNIASRDDAIGRRAQCHEAELFSHSLQRGACGLIVSASTIKSIERDER